MGFGGFPLNRVLVAGGGQVTTMMDVLVTTETATTDRIVS
jgi:hypothetical protein